METSECAVSSHEAPPIGSDEVGLGRDLGSLLKSYPGLSDSQGFLRHCDGALVPFLRH